MYHVSLTSSTCYSTLVICGHPLPKCSFYNVQHHEGITAAAGHIAINKLNSCAPGNPKLIEVVQNTGILSITLKL